MSPAVAKAAITGVIVSISIIAALGLAVIENPQVKEWLEEQRQRVAELLRQIGQELDPESRRTAEAFAFEGRTTANDEGLRREAAGSQDAAAVATGRSMSNATVRRIPIQGRMEPNEAEERRRKGREYLAMRNQQMYELQQRRKAAKAAGEATPPTPTFDELVDAEGKLKEAGVRSEDLPSPPAMEPLPEAVQEGMRHVERTLSQPLMSESSVAAPSGWNAGAAFANPFGDEFALERSITPKPPAVPPKIELSRVPSPEISIPGSFETPAPATQPAQEITNIEGLSYEEQLAIAMSLSESEGTANAATVRQNPPEAEDDELAAAIAASLKDMDDQQAAHAIAHAESNMAQSMHDAEPLVDLTPSTPRATSPRPPQGEWGHLLDRHFPPAHEPWSLAPSSATVSEASDELYRLTPELTRAHLAHHDALHAPPEPSTPAGTTLPFDPVREAARGEVTPAQDAMEASFYSAPDELDAPSPASTHTLNHERLVDIDDAPQDGQRTPTSRTQSGFGFYTDSDTDTFASVSAPASRAQSRPRSEISAPASRTQSRPRSEISAIEVVDLVEDSDVDMLSEEGDGIATPDSWSEVGSRDADSDMEDSPRPSRSSS